LIVIVIISRNYTTHIEARMLQKRLFNAGET